MRRQALLCLLPFVICACDASVTDIDDIDADVLAQVARVSAGDATPAERVLVELLRRDDADWLTDTASDLPQLDSLFALTLADPDRESSARAPGVRARYEQLVRQAWDAIDAGDASGGERLLVGARALQSEVVGQRLGKAGALGYIALIERALDRARRQTGPQTPLGLASMLDSAVDLCEDASRAVRDDRLAEAFDLASHAAGLANAFATGHPRD